ncbi:MAG: ASKHA domain-containing protein [Acidobacteriia bacterium]|nr:ASKHA domain-containing protein [Terriglobia bacterium]
MDQPVRIRLEPLGEVIEVASGTPLKDVLFLRGVEFPCGGHGRCKRCRIKVLAGNLPIAAAEESLLSPGELAEGWRLACHARPETAVTLEVAQWETAILADDSTFDFTPGEGLGIAVDLGTTTLVAQLLDLSTGRTLAVSSTLNPQATCGADIMSRVQYAVLENGQHRLEAFIRGAIGRLIRNLLQGWTGPEAPPVRRITIVGNTVMHHLFCGIDVTPLSRVPFEPVRDGLEVFRATDLGWEIAGDAPVNFLPCLGGFVGSDILAGFLATRMQESDALVGLIDLGTNGEIAFGTRDRIICASTAAGPAFEGGLISMGMRASTGAITEVTASDGGLQCRVIGNASPRGICGSGLVDAVAVGLEHGYVQPNGRLPGPSHRFPLCPPVELTQGDIRQLQLAKGAVAAGIRIILARLGASPSDVQRVYLAGAFGNYINRTSARRIGLIDFPNDVVEPAGNTALLGAKLALFTPDIDFASIRARVQHIVLSADPNFEEIYVGEMGFPTA